MVGRRVVLAYAMLDVAPARNVVDVVRGGYLGRKAPGLQLRHEVVHAFPYLLFKAAPVIPGEAVAGHTFAGYDGGKAHVGGFGGGNRVGEPRKACETRKKMRILLHDVADMVAGERIQHDDEHVRRGPAQAQMLLRPVLHCGNGFGLCKKQAYIGNAAQRYGHGQGHSQQSPKKHPVFIEKERHYAKNGKAHGHIHIFVPAEFYYRSAFEGIGVKNAVIPHHEEGIDDKDKGQRTDKEGKDNSDIAAAGIENQKRNGNGQQYPDGQERKGMDTDKGLVGQHEPCRSIGEDKKRHKEQGARVQHIELVRAEAFRKSLREPGKTAGTVEKYRQQECGRQPHGVLVMDRGHDFHPSQ